VRPPLQALLGVVLGDLLPSRVELSGVAHISQRDRGSDLSQELPQSEGVVVIRRTVVGDNKVSRHRAQHIPMGHARRLPNAATDQQSPPLPNGEPPHATQPSGPTIQPRTIAWCLPPDARVVANAIALAATSGGQKQWSRTLTRNGAEAWGIASEFARRVGDPQAAASLISSQAGRYRRPVGKKQRGSAIANCTHDFARLHDHDHLDQANVPARASACERERSQR